MIDVLRPDLLSCQKPDKNTGRSCVRAPALIIVGQQWLSSKQRQGRQRSTCLSLCTPDTRKS